MSCASRSRLPTMPKASSSAAKRLHSFNGAPGSQVRRCGVAYLPFSVIEQAFLLGEDWWDKACCSVGGVTQRHEDMVRFAVRQFLDTLAPTNFIATNPVVQRRISETGGQCLIDGTLNWLDDMTRSALHEPPQGCRRLPARHRGRRPRG